MDEDLRHQAVKLCVLIFVIPVFLGFVAASPGGPLGPSWVAQQYCNDKYLYCVDLPRSGKAEPHEGDAPNHGVTIELPEPGDEFWTYAHWDAALLSGSQKAALAQIEIIFRKHPDAEVRVARTMLAGLSAYRVRFTYADTQPMTEEIIIAYRKPKDESKDTGIIYEIGMKCTRSTYRNNIGTFESFVGTFEQTEK